jgi:hypothetical protein
MSEPFDIYSDSMMISMNAWGAAVSFQLNEAHPVPQTPSQPSRLGTVRMSNEHLKIMAYVMRRHIMQNESNAGVRYNIPTAVLSQMGIAPEDWDSFWSRERN